MANARAEKTISVVVPAFNEEAGIQATVRILAEVLGAVGYRYEIVVIDDGSRDHTFERAAQLTDSGMPVRAIRLSRNFGKEGALLAGLENARGDAVITIDADLQHPPSLIPEMVAAWERGARIVHGVKRRRGDEKWWASARAYVVNNLITMLGGIDVQHSSDFKLLFAVTRTACRVEGLPGERTLAPALELGRSVLALHASRTPTHRSPRRRWPSSGACCSASWRTTFVAPAESRLRPMACSTTFRLRR